MDEVAWLLNNPFTTVYHINSQESVKIDGNMAIGIAFKCTSHFEWTKEK